MNMVLLGGGGDVATPLAESWQYQSFSENHHMTIVKAIAAGIET